MANTDLKNFSTRVTPQDRPASSKQAKNNAGGYSFVVDDLTRLKRFLILGSSSTYYATGAELTLANAEVVVKMATQDSRTLVDTIVDVSTRGAAPKVDQAIFALAIAVSHGSDADKAYALSKLNQVVRTATHLFQFVTYVEQFRGWGRGLRTGVAGWYTAKSADKLAYQVVKYRNREGWTHRDVLRKCHAMTTDPVLNSVLRWAVSGEVSEQTPELIAGYIEASKPGADVPALIAKYRLSWEMLPTDALADPEVWKAMLIAKSLPLGALVRQLSRLTRIGLFDGREGFKVVDVVVAMLTDREYIRASRLHPVSILNAERTYRLGYSTKGTSTWTPNTRILDALSDAFLVSFENVESTGTRILHALDVSGSMAAVSYHSTTLTPREMSAALALVSMSVEPDNEVIGFTGPHSMGWGSMSTIPTAKMAGRTWSSPNGGRGYWNRDAGMTNSVTPLSISPRQRLSDAIDVVSNLPFGDTDCAAPMLWALDQNKAFDAFVVYTDNDTWSGQIHPHQALRMYNETMGLNARLIVVGMTATEFSIADPEYAANMLDVVGMDTALPKIITEFASGQI